MDSHSHLNNGRINANFFREQAQQQLIAFFDKISGTKTIIWDRGLVGPIGLLLDYPFLKRSGVSQMYMLGASSAVTTEHVIFFVRPLCQLMDQLKQSIIEEDANKRQYHVLFAPRSNVVCEQLIQEIGLSSLLSSVRSFPAYVFPLDHDVLSLEMGHVFRSLHIDQDPSSLYDIATALVHIQQLYGKIPTVYGVGSVSRQVYTLMQKQMRTIPNNQFPDDTGKAAIDGIFLIDRSLDLYSPLLTQLTYEGLLDEHFGIRNNSVKISAAKFAQLEQPTDKNTSTINSKPNEDPPTELKQIVLHSGEQLHVQLRDLNFNAVPPFLKQTSRKLNDQFEQRHQARSVGELRAFVERIPQLQATKKSLATHLILAEQLSDLVSSESFRNVLSAEQQLLMSQQTDQLQAYVEESISCNQPINQILRLLCLQSLITNGIKSKQLDILKRELLHVYGFEQLLTLNNLTKCGLFKAAGSNSSASLQNKNNPNRNFATVSRLLKLTVDNVNEQQPTDAAYVHSCFAPFAARVCALLMQNGWKAVADVMRQLNEVHFEYKSSKRNSSSSIRQPTPSINSGSTGTEESRTLLVFFIGGCTFAEISSLRFLTRQEEANVDLIVGTTKLINGNSFMESLYETLDASE